MPSKRFTAYAEWADWISELDERIQLRILRAVFSYADKSIVPDDFSALERALFAPIRSAIDLEREQQKLLSEKRRDAGRKGGAPIGNTNAQAKQAKQANGCINKQNKQNQAKQASDFEEKEINEKENLPPTPPIKEKENKEKETNLIINRIDDLSTSNEFEADAQPSEHIKYDGIIEFWNNLVTDKAMRKLQSIDHTRRSMVQARIKEFGKVDFAKGLRHAAASSFLNGNNKGNKIFTFDWIIRPNNFPKVLEGQYDDKLITTIDNGNNHTNNDARLAAEDAIRRIADIEQRGFGMPENAW